MLEKGDIGKLIKNKYFEKHKEELPKIMTYDIVNNKIKIYNINQQMNANPLSRKRKAFLCVLQEG